MADLDGTRQSPASTPRAEYFIFDVGVTVALSTHQGIPPTTFALREPIDPQTLELGATYREITQLIASFVRIVIAFYLLTLMLFIRACLSLKRRCFQLLTSRLSSQGWLRRRFMSSHIHDRILQTTDLIGRIYLLALRIRNAVLDYPEPQTNVPNVSALGQNGESPESHGTDSVAVRSIEHPSSCFHHWALQHRRDVQHTLVSSRFYNVSPSKEHSTANSPSNGLHECFVNSMGPRCVIHGFEVEGRLSDDPPECTRETEDESQTASHTNTDLAQCEQAPPTPTESSKSSVCLSSSTSPKSSTRLFWLSHSPEESTDAPLSNGPVLHHVGNATTTCEASPDPAHAESFSPIAFTFPPDPNTHFLETRRSVSHGSLEERPTAESVPIQSNSRPSTPTRIPSHHSSIPTKTLKRSSTGTIPSPRAMGDHNQGGGYHLNKIRPQYKEPKLWKHTREESGGDNCDDTCVACETCNRRHKRTWPSKLPRKVKTLEPFQRRSSSFSGCRSTRISAASPTPSMTKKLQKSNTGIA